MREVKKSEKNATIIKNFKKLTNAKYIYFFIPSVASLSFVKGFEDNTKKQIIFVTFEKATYDCLKNASKKAIFCNSYKKKSDVNNSSYLRRLKNRWDFNESILSLLIHEVASKDEYMFYLTCIDYWGALIARAFFNSEKDIHLQYIQQPKKIGGTKKVFLFDPNFIINQIIDSLTYRLPLYWHKYARGLGLHLGVDDKFLKKYNISKVYGFEYIFQNPSILDISIKNKKVISQLIIGGYSIDGAKHFYDTSDVINIYNAVNNNCKDAYHKYHPGEVIKDALSDSFHQIDPNIPIEYSGYKIRVAISDFSNALVLLSSQGTICVSFLKLVNIKKGFDRNAIIQDLSIKTSYKVLFPETLDEFIALIK